MTDFLNLPNVQTTAVEELSDRYIVQAKAIGPVAATCALSCPVKKNGTKVREINDTPIHGKGVLIRYRGQRFACDECGNGGLYERLPFVQDGFWMTGRLLVHMGKQAMRRTFAEVARECFVDRKTASNAFNAYVSGQIAQLKRKTPRVLGIDEKMLLGGYRAVLGNIEARTVLDMLPDREGSLERYLIDLPDRQSVEVICTDRYDAYRLMIAKRMPGRLHVTDRFHIVAKASETLDRIRASVAKSLPDRRRGASLRMARQLFRSRWSLTTEEQKATITRWGQEVPILRDAYWAKEHYADMYLCTSPAEAERYYKAWLRDLPESVADRFRASCSIPPRWMPMVLAYFEAPFTTGYVESINRFLDDLQRDGRGYSFEVIRAKLMLAEKLESKTFRRRSSIALSREVTEAGGVNLGADLGKMDAVLREEPSVIEFGDRTVTLAHGLSTLWAGFASEYD